MEEHLLQPRVRDEDCRSAEDESDFVIALLNQVVATSPEVQVRFRWGEGDVAFWDNRCTVCLSFFSRLSPLQSLIVVDWIANNV